MSRLARIASLVCGCAAAAAAQPQPLRVYEALPARADPELHAALAGEAARARVIGVEVLAITQRTFGAPGLLVGAPAAALEELGRRGGLAPWPEGVGADLAPRARRGAYVLPWSAPIVIGHGAAWRGEEAPRDWDDLAFDTRFDGEVVVCEPWAMPALWIAWIRAGVRRGGEEWAFAWLRGLDARVRGYVSSPAAAAASLQRSPRAVAPVHLGDVLAALARGNDVGWTTPASGLLAEPIGVAVLAGAEGAVVRDALERLLAPERVAAIARVAGWLPRLRDARIQDLPADLREVAGRARVVQPGRDEAARWFVRWEAEVKGVGRRQANLEWVAEAVFTIAFFGFLVWVYRHLGRSEGHRGRA